MEPAELEAAELEPAELEAAELGAVDAETACGEVEAQPRVDAKPKSWDGWD